MFLTGLVSAAIILFYLKNGAFPDPQISLCAWDCGWYIQLRDQGYILKLDDESNPAFFPLFSYMWKWLSFSFIQISLLNASLFVLSVSVLYHELKIESRAFVFFMCIGLLTFFTVPYSESLFFMGSCIFLIGLHKEQKPLTILGFTIAVLARSASIIFIAASVVLLIIAIVQQQKEKITQMIIAVLTTVCTTLFVMSVQYYQTGDFFAFFYAQQFWDHHLGLPSFPLSSWHWPTHLSDSSGLLFGLIAIVISLGFCLRLIFKLEYPRFLERLFTQTPMDYAYLFSFLYLAGTSSTILLFQGGNIHSLNRYIFSTPFFLLFINAFISKKITVNFTFLQYVIFACILGVFMPRQTYVEHYLLVTGVIIFIPASLLFQSRAAEHKGYNFLLYLGLIAGFLLQIFLLSKYYSGNWMG